MYENQAQFYEQYSQKSGQKYTDNFGSKLQ